MEYWNIILGFILIILVYCFYLNIIKNNQVKEGFEMDNENNNKIQKLIEIKDSNFFSSKIWDNYNILSNNFLC